MWSKLQCDIFFNQNSTSAFLPDIIFYAPATSKENFSTAVYRFNFIVCSELSYLNVLEHKWNLVKHCVGNEDTYYKEMYIDVMVVFVGYMVLDSVLDWALNYSWNFICTQKKTLCIYENILGCPF